MFVLSLCSFNALCCIIAHSFSIHNVMKKIYFAKCYCENSPNSLKIIKTFVYK